MAGGKHLDSSREVGERRSARICYYAAMRKEGIDADDMMTGETQEGGGRGREREREREERVRPM